MATSQEMTLDDLFLDTLKDIYYAEKQIVKALPKMAKAAQNPKLKAGFEKHMDETQGHIDRLEQVFELIGKPARGKTCDAILGILEEGKSIMEDYKGTISRSPLKRARVGGDPAGEANAQLTASASECVMLGDRATIGAR